MTAPQQVSLTPIPILPGEPEYQKILEWPFPAAPFYEAQVSRILAQDMQNWISNSYGQAWSFRDPGGAVVGFGTLALNDLYHDYSGGLRHMYIPVLGLHPEFRGKGY